MAVTISIIDSVCDRSFEEFCNKCVYLGEQILCVVVVKL